MSLPAPETPRGTGKPSVGMTLSDPVLKSAAWDPTLRPARQTVTLRTLRRDGGNVGRTSSPGPRASGREPLSKGYPHGHEAPGAVPRAADRRHGRRLRPASYWDPADRPQSNQECALC